MAAHEEEWGASGEAILPRCKRCKLVQVPPRPDPCLGVLEGVESACCGHARPDHAHVVFVDDDGNEQALYGEEALAYFRSRGVGPFGDPAERARNTA
jgi:hypothetical protein